MTTWTELRNGTVERLIAAGIAGGRVASSRYASIEADGSSQARVYLRKGQYRADGDPRAGEPSFVRERVLVISLVRAAGITEELDDDLDADIEDVLEALLTDPSYLSEIEGIGSAEIEYVSKTEGEFRTIEAVIEIEVLDRIQFEPAIADSFESLSFREAGEDAEPLHGVDLYPPDGSIEIALDIPIPQD